MKIKKINIKDNGSFLTILKGALNALIISLLGILLFAFIIKLTSISDGLIKPINQVIKIISVLFGCLMAFKKGADKTIFKGILIGICYTVFAFVLFSALNGKFEFNSSLLLDILFSGALGLISAIICNIFKKR